MAIANPVDTYQGLAVPLYPNKGTVITQQTAAGGSDLLTLSVGASSTDNVLVARKGTTNQMYVKYNGHINLKSYTTKVTTGLTKGDLFLIWHNTTPRLQIAIDSTTHKGIRLKTKTIGRLTA